MAAAALVGLAGGSGCTEGAHVSQRQDQHWLVAGDTVLAGPLGVVAPTGGEKSVCPESCKRHSFRTQEPQTQGTVTSDH